MKYSRRDFIKAGALATSFIPAFNIFGFGRANDVNETPSSQNYDSFGKLIGSQFTFFKADSSATGVLIEVKSFETPGKRMRGECFSMVFELDADNYPGDTYQIFHPSMGMFELLTVGGRSEKTSLLIGVINRL